MVDYEYTIHDRLLLHGQYRNLGVHHANQQHLIYRQHIDCQMALKYRFHHEYLYNQLMDFRRHNRSKMQAKNLLHRVHHCYKTLVILHVFRNNHTNSYGQPIVLHQNNIYHSKKYLQLLIGDYFRQQKHLQV